MNEMFFIIVLVLIGLRSLYDLGMFVLSVVWLKRNVDTGRKTDEIKFTVVITVLWEQYTLRATVESLLRSSYTPNNLNVVIVTTEKEFTRSFEANTLSTVELAMQLQSECPQRVHHLHYPYVTGAKAEQMNHAIDWLLSDLTLGDESMFVAFYDADSRPHPETFRLVASLAQDSDRRVFQQSAVFFQNFNKLRKGNGLIAGALLQANAILQTRWTLVHEIPRVLRQSFALRHWHKRIFLSHCVGHGLFLRKDLLREIQSIPAKTMTEDLFLGFILSLRGEPIQAVPVLESADMPRSIVAAMRQKYVWYFGPFDHVVYAKHVIRDRLCRAPDWLTYVFAIKGLVPALAWLLSGWMILYVLVYPLVTQQSLALALSVGVLGMYVSTFVLTAGMHVWLKKLTGQQVDVCPKGRIWALFWLVPMLVIHGIPPIVSLVAKARSILTGVKPYKPKTEE